VCVCVCVCVCVVFFIHTQVVGKKMPRYHLFGETVTIAEAMESKGVPTRVVIRCEFFLCVIIIIFFFFLLLLHIVMPCLLLIIMQIFE